MSKGKNLKTKALASVMAASMVVSAFPATAFAVTGDKVAKDAEYVKNAVVQAVNDPDESMENDYSISVSLTVADGVFKAINVTSDDVTDDDSPYLNRAVNGTKTKPGIVSLEGQPATEDTINSWDGVSGATVASNAIKTAALEAINEAEEAESTPDPAPSPSESVEPTAEYVYGTVNLSYADFYYGELNDVAENSTMDLTAEDKVTAAGYREDGMYDAVTSATANKWQNMFADVTYTQALETGGQILGLKDVNIAVPAELYNEAKAAIDAGTACSNSLLSIVEAMTVNEDQNQVPSEYKILNGDGTLTKLTSETVEDSAAVAQLSTSSRYGNYQVNVTSDYLTGSNSEILGVVFETATGEKYGMEHLENIWRGGSQVSFAVVDGFVESHGNTVDAARSKGLEGQTITKLTYMLKDKADVVVNTRLYVPYQVPGGKGVTLDTENLSEDGTSFKVPVYISNPDGGNYVLDSVSYGGNTLTAGTDYELVDEQWLAYDNLKINDTENTGIGSYTVTFKDENGKYIDLSVSFTRSSSYADGDVKLENNALVMPDGLDVAAYLKNVSSISVNGTALRGNNLGTTVFNEDGTVNFDATITNKGNTTAVFAEKGAEYTIEVKSTGYPTVSGTVQEKVAEDEYTYVYAGLTWSEYWASEGVYAAGSTASSEEADARGEYDKGAFDAVTRATTNHGLHRGSFQMMATIYDTDGNAYAVSHWSEDGSTITLTDGSTIGFSKGAITKADGTTATMDHYEVSGIKYVPVKVKTADYEAFAAKYNVVQNDGALVGGYAENQLVSYAATAEVTEATNGLKTATMNEDGSFSFSARETGTDSGIKDASLKTAAPTVTAKEADGAYGEFLRVDMTGDYGDLGSNMQAVRWDYYGTDSTYTNLLASYGTKFAADNWMHKSNGIQLGLTDSLRCRLPDGTDGTGYWKLTLYALGYNDYTVTFEATADNIVKPAEETVDTSALEAAVAKAEALTESDYTAESWSSMQTELSEAKDVLAAESTTQAIVDEALSHLNAAIEALVEAEKSEYVYGTVNLPYADFYYGELTGLTEVDKEMNLTTGDKVSKYRKSGVYDSVSSATTAKSTKFSSTYYTQTSSGVEIEGIKAVNIAVPTELYEAAKAAIEEGKNCNNSLLDIVGSMTVNEDQTAVPSEYKILNGDGTLTAMVGNTVVDEAATATISTGSVWGNYLIEVTSDNLPTSENIQGGLLIMTDGTVYGLEHLENLWLRMDEIAFTVEDNFVEPHGNTMDARRYKGIEGKTISQIVYMVANGDDVAINTNLKVKRLLSDDQGAAAENGTLNNGAQVPVTLNVPESADYKLTSVTAGGKTLTEGTDYTYENGILTLNATENVVTGTYSLTFTDDEYEDITTSFVLKSAEYAEGTAKIEGNKLVLPDGLDMAEYLASITAVKAGDTTFTTSGIGTIVFNADGSVNFDAKTTGRGAATVFPDKTASYEVEVTSSSYPNASGTVQCIDTTALAAAIDKTADLESRDYTDESWDAMKIVLELAKSELAAPQSQETVNTAAANLNAALEALEDRVELPIFKITNKCPASYTMDLTKQDNAGYAKNKTQITTTWDDIEGVQLSYQWISTNTSIVRTALGTASGMPKNSTIITRGLKKGSATCICIVKATLPDGTTATTAHAMVIKVNLTSLKVTSSIPSSKTISISKGTYKMQVNTNWDNIPGVKLTYKWTAKSSSTVKTSLSTSSGKPKNSCLNLKGRKKGTTNCTLTVTAKLPGGDTQTVTKTVKVKVVK